MQISKGPKIQIRKTVEFNIHERIYRFTLEVVNLTRTLRSTPQNLVFINQILRSATSVAANDQEADAAESRKDFIAKYTIVKKELKETAFWLRIIKDTDQTINNDINILRNESDELLKIVSKIIINTKNKP